MRIEARRLGLTPTKTANSESVSAVFKEGWHFIIPLVVLVGFLVAGRTPTTSAAFAILTVIGASWISKTPMMPKDIFDAVVDGVKTTLPLFRRLIEEEDVITGNYDIHWLERWLDAHLAET